MTDVDMEAVQEYNETIDEAVGQAIDDQIPWVYIIGILYAHAHFAESASTSTSTFLEAMGP